VSGTKPHDATGSDMGGREGAGVGIVSCRESGDRPGLVVRRGPNIASVRHVPLLWKTSHWAGFSFFDREGNDFDTRHS
jgi:hypothetical protein